MRINIDAKLISKILFNLSYYLFLQAESLLSARQFRPYTFKLFANYRITSVSIYMVFFNILKSYLIHVLYFLLFLKIASYISIFFMLTIKDSV